MSGTWPAAPGLALPAWPPALVGVPLLLTPPAFEPPLLTCALPLALALLVLGSGFWAAWALAGLLDPACDRSAVPFTASDVELLA